MAEPGAETVSEPEEESADRVVHHHAGESQSWTARFRKILSHESGSRSASDPDLLGADPFQEPMLGEDISDTAGIPRVRVNMWRTWLVIGICILAVAAFFLLKSVGEALALILTIAIIVFILRRPVAFFQRKGLSRSAGTWLAYLCMFVVLAIVVLLFIPPLVNQGTAFAETIPGYINVVTEWISNLAMKYQGFFEDEDILDLYSNVVSDLSAKLGTIAQISATGILNVGGSLANTVLVLVLGFLAGFWILRDLPALGRELRVLAGPKRGGDLLLVSTICARVFDGYIKGTLIVALFIGVFSTIAFLIIGLPFPTFLGFFLGFLRIIPYIGPLVGVVSVTLLAIVVKGPLIGLIVCIVSIVIVEIGGLAILPKIMSSQVELHPAIILIVIILGGAAFGALGMILATPVVAAIKALFVYYFERKTGRQILSKDGLLFQGDPDRRIDVFDQDGPDGSASTSSRAKDYPYSSPSTFMSFVSVDSKEKLSHHHAQNAAEATSADEVKEAFDTLYPSDE